MGSSDVTLRVPVWALVNDSACLGVREYRLRNMFGRLESNMFTFWTLEFETPLR